MAIENKYDAVARADKVIASCTTLEQLRVARKFAERAYALMYPALYSGLRGATASRIVESLTTSRRMDIDPEYREREERRVFEQVESYAAQARARIAHHMRPLPEPYPASPTARVSVDVSVTVD